MSWWSEEDIEAAIRMRHEGLSAAEIGKLLGRTRNAVLGLAFRRGISRPQTRSKPKTVPIKKEEYIKPKPSLSADQIRSIQDVSKDSSFVRRFNKVSLPSEHNVSIYELTSQNCHWPIGKYGERAKMFCGAPTHDNVYCPYHRAVGTIPIRPQSRFYIPPRWR